MRPLQGLAFLLLMQSGGEALSHFLKLPVPGPVVGMVLLLLALRWSPVQAAVAPAAGFLLSHLSLLFVPVGVEKLSSMCVQFTTEENAQMFGLKHAFDPAGLLNPGKVIPTLNRCAEYGKMLVRGGQIKHPDLPRF